MKALVYTRPRLAEFYHALADCWLGKSSCSFMSDHKHLEPISIMDRFYRVYKTRPKTRLARIPLTAVDYHSIITRCRYLRHVAYDEAVRMVNSMWVTMDDIIGEQQPDVILGQVMDSYVSDVCDRVARQYDRCYSGFLNNMVNGYSRLTSRGELWHWRIPKPGETEQALAMLRQNTYAPRMQRDFVKALPGPVVLFFTKYMRERVKSAYYLAAKAIQRDPCNFYYNTVASTKHAMACAGVSYLYYRRYEQTNWRALLDEAERKNARIVYLPLQFYPECSVDYWGTAAEMREFDSVVSHILASAADDLVIITKEHPSACGLRSPRFYAEIRSRSNVILVPAGVPSVSLIETADVVATWTGSVGVEAAVRGVPLITFGDAYYDPDERFKRLATLPQLGDLSMLVDQAMNDPANPGDEAQIQEMVSRMLSGLVPGYVFPLDFGKHRRHAEAAQLNTITQGLTGLFEKLGTRGGPLRNGSLS